MIFKRKLLVLLLTLLFPSEGRVGMLNSWLHCANQVATKIYLSIKIISKRQYLRTFKPYSESCKISKIERFVGKRSILVVCQGSEYASEHRNLLHYTFRSNYPVCI